MVNHPYVLIAEDSPLYALAIEVLEHELETWDGNYALASDETAVWIVHLADGSSYLRAHVLGRRNAENGDFDRYTTRIQLDRSHRLLEALEELRWKDLPDAGHDRS